jgi:hypothetical protein
MRQAHGVPYGMAQRQASMLSFIDAFWMLALLFLGPIPLMFIMKKTRARRGGEAME